MLIIANIEATTALDTTGLGSAFCIVMGSKDHIDASDRLLRLSLKMHWASLLLHKLMRLS